MSLSFTEYMSLTRNVFDTSAVTPAEAIKVLETQPATPKPWTLAELIRTNFEPFKRFDPDTFKQLVSAIEYVEEMASTLKIDIRNWDLIETFKHPQDETRIVIDRRAINKRLYERGEQEKRGIPHELAPNEKQLIDTALALVQKARENIKKELQNHIHETLRDTERHLSRYNDAMGQYWDYRRRILAIENKLESRKDFEAIQAVIQTGRWKFHSIIGEDVALTSVYDSILTEKNPAAGVDLRVNLGSFKILLSLRTYKMTVHLHQANITTNGFYHPYIHRGGNICWGNAADTADQMRRRGDIVGLFELIDSLLHNYSPDTTPYESLVSFQQSANGILPEGQQRRAATACQTCNEIVDDCQCHTCEYCDELVRDGESCPRCCEECGNSRDDCRCCSICQGTNFDECGCCPECNMTQDDCTRCQECSEHSHTTEEHGQRMDF